MAQMKASYEGRTIYRVNEFDLLSIPKVAGNLYACTDSRRMYEDISATERRVMSVQMIATEVDRQYNLRPTNATYYYVWETNELWLYHYGWELIIGNKTDETNQYVGSTGISYVKNSGCCQSNNNGILGDGSVVVRDSNRVIKGKIYIDEENNELVFSSFLGGGLRFLPSGSFDEDGSLDISDGVLNYQGDAWIKGNLFTTDDIYVVKESGQYKVYTEEDFVVGEWEFNGNDIVQKLGELPQPVNIDVQKFDGHTSDYYAKTIHKHVSSDITDLEKFVKDNRYASLMTGNHDRGIQVEYDQKSDTYKFVPSPFLINIIGGVDGFATVRDLGDTTIEVTVNPDEHKHSLIDMLDWNEFKTDFDLKMYTSKFEEEVTKTAKPDKLLYLDGSGKLPADITGNSASTDKLKVQRLIKLSDGVTGQAMFDGSADIDIAVTVDPKKHEHDQYLLTSLIGTKVPPLNNELKIDPIYFYDYMINCLQYQGTFNPSNGYPTNNLTKGKYWVASSEGTISGTKYFIGDWIVYNGSSWDPIHSKGMVHSVNNQIGDITISAETLNVLEKSELFDPLNPQEGKIITTVYDEETNEYYPNVSIRSEQAKYASYLLNPIKMQFISKKDDPELGGDLSSNVFYLNLSESDEINQIGVTLSTDTIKVDGIDDGVVS